MSARTIGDLLMTFDVKPEPIVAPKSRVVPFEPRPAAAPPRQKDAAAKVEEAYERGRQDGHAAAVADCEAKLKEHAIALIKRNADERERWLAEQSSVLAEQLTTTWVQFESALAGTLARLLEPFLTGAIHQQAIREFILHLDAVVKEPTNAVLQISGPADLLDAIKAKVDVGPVAVQYVPNTRCEVRLTSDHAIVETQMAAWIKRLKQ